MMCYQSKKQIEQNHRNNLVQLLTLVDLIMFEVRQISWMCLSKY